MDSYRIRCFYEKKGISKFISSKNFQQIIERSLRRLDISLKFTEGYSPRLKMSFGPPLPVNVAGLNEYFDFHIVEKIDTDLLIKNLNPILPDGVKIKEAIYSTSKVSVKNIVALYTIEGERLEKETFEGLGKIVEYNRKKVEILIKLNNFRHKEILSLLEENKINNIYREIVKI